LVGQVQLLPSTLLTGDSFGKLRYWNLADYSEIHKIDAHDNSVTSVGNIWIVDCEWGIGWKV
jgi:hypothetical protein